MTVHQLPTARISDEIAMAHASIDAAAAVPVGVLAECELGTAVAALESLKAKVTALEFDVLAEAQRRAAEEEEADTDTGAWAAKLTGTTRGVMSGGLLLAKLLREKYDATRTAFAAGRINEEQMRLIVRAAEKLPEKVTNEQRRIAEEDLVEKAVAGMNARRLRHAARRMLDKISKELADEHEADELTDEEERAEVETWMTLSDNGDGTVSGRFVIPELSAQFLRQALEHLTSPRRLGRNKAGKPVVDDTMSNVGENLSYTERLGRGFCELLEHLPTDGFHAVGATVLVHMQLEHLRNALGSGRLDTGIPHLARRGTSVGLRGGHRAACAERQVRGPRRRPSAASAQRCPATCAVRSARDLCRRRLRTPVRLVRDPSSACLG